VSAVGDAVRHRKARAASSSAGGFIRSVALLRDRVPSFDAYPYSIPAVRHLVTRGFLMDRESYLRRLFEDSPGEGP